MNKQYSLIYILPYCIEMTIIQYDTNEFEIFDRLMKTINIEEDLKKNCFSKKNIFKMLNIIYGYKSVITENGLNDCIVIIDEDLNALENINNLFRGVNKIFNKNINIIKSMNKSYLVFLFLLDIFKHRNNQDNGVIRFEDNILEIYGFKNSKLIDFQKQKLYDKKPNRFFKNRENTIREIMKGIVNLIKLNQIDIDLKCQNNILIVNFKEYKFLNKFFEKNNVNRNKFNKVMKRIVNMKYYEIKNFYNITDEEVEKLVYILSAFEVLLNEKEYNIEIKKFDINWYFTKELILKKKELYNEVQYYEFLYAKFIVNNCFKNSEIKYLNNITKNIAEILEKNSFKIQKKNIILIKIGIIISLYNVEVNTINVVGFQEDDVKLIKKWIDLLKFEELLNKRGNLEISEFDNFTEIIYIIYYVMILKKSKIPFEVKKNNQKLSFNINKENLTLFEIEIFNCIKGKIRNSKQGNIMITFY